MLSKKRSDFSSKHSLTTGTLVVLDNLKKIIKRNVIKTLKHLKNLYEIPSQSSCLKSIVKPNFCNRSVYDKLLSTLQETRATLQKTPATLQKTRATLHETCATLQETPATLQETRATLQETPATLGLQETRATL